MKSQISMAARKATKVNKNERKGLDNSNEIKEENIQSSYFKDCNSGISIQPRKKPRLKPEKKEEPVSLTQLGRTFYDKPTESLAKELLGKLLYRVLDDGEVLCGRIVETEGYLGEVDKACHSFGGKKTARTEPVYMAPGTAYVYIIYGMYHCLNISSHESGACVLIRALEPLQGLSSMKSFRGARRSDGGSKLKDYELCNGPSKLCQALCVEKDNLNKEDMATSNRFWLEDGKDCCEEDITIVTSTRIGIDSYGPEWALKPLRFYILGSKCVSVKDKKMEANLLSIKTPVS